MTEPVTTVKSLIVPNTGDLAGAWGTSALNPNFQTIDALFGGVTTISLTSATTLLLTVPATTGVWFGSLSQSVNSLIKFTGVQTGNAIIQFTLPGFYIINNQCTGTSYVQLANQSGAGNKIGAPPGKKCHVFFDGTDMDYVNMPDPGTAYDFHTNTTSLPPWMLACTVAPYLLKDGSTYSSVTYPALAQYLGSTFGGNGVTTFGVPDERARARMAVDTIQAASGATSARITFAVAGFTGSLLGAAGGDQRMPTHNHGITDTGHTHTFIIINSSGGNPQASGSISGSLGNQTTNNSVTGITINNAGTGSSANVPPAIISFLPLMKT